MFDAQAIYAKADRVRENYRRQAEGVNADHTLSLAGRQERLDALWQTMQDSLQAVREAWDLGVVEERERLRGLMVPLAVDRSAVRLALTEIIDADEDTLNRMVRVATLSGDAALWSALAIRATTTPGLLTDLPEAHAHRAERLAEFERAHGESRGAAEKFSHLAHMTVPMRVAAKPPQAPQGGGVAVSIGRPLVVRGE